VQLEGIFRTGDTRADNFRSRLFGMFSEDIPRIWGQNPNAPYAWAGRPTLYEGTGWATIDHLFRDSAGRAFVAEQKSELAWMGYAYLRLDNPGQLDHHRGKPAFDWFLEAATDPARRAVKVGGKAVAIDGAILVWGAVDRDRRDEVRQAFGFHDILSLEEMLEDLRAWQDPAWAARLDELAAWTDGMLGALR
jgi:hypothetical protein